MFKKVTKPIAATSEEWDQWESVTKALYPVWYFLHETVPDNFRYWRRRLSDVKYWIAHRTYDKYHVVRVYGMKPRYADKDYIMFHVCFGLLVDFVECESAWMHYIFKYHYDPPFRWRNLLFWKHFHSPTDGLAHLDWAATLVWDKNSGMTPGDEGYGELTHQAIAAREQKELYLWYMNRQNRPDEHEASGWYAICRRKESGEVVPQEEIRAALDRCHEVETTYEQEDEDMLVRLMKIRGSLWT